MSISYQKNPVTQLQNQLLASSNPPDNPPQSPGDAHASSPPTTPHIKSTAN
jgi:hypothetical protein